MNKNMPLSEKTIIDDFYKNFFRMDFNKAAYSVGIMKYLSMPNYIYYEALLLYEQKQFNRLRILLSDKELSWQEQELYIASLAELGMYEAAFKQLDNSGPISIYGFYYIGYILEKLGHPYTKNHDVLHKDDTYFQSQYKWSIFFDLSEIYFINKEKMLMKDAQIPKKHIKHLNKSMQNIIAKIRINDPFLEEIKNAIADNKEIDTNHILWFPIRYLGDSNPDNTPKLFHSFSTIYDIIRYVQLCMKIDYPTVECDTFIEYMGDLEEEAKLGNEHVINLLKEIYLKTHYYHRFLLNENENYTISDVYKSIIQKYSPSTISEIEIHETDAEVYSILSATGQIAYRAAVWQFDNVFKGNIGTLDAGMLCLSYMRILELELNQRLFRPLKDYKDTIIHCYEANLNALSKGSSQDDFFKRWSALSKIESQGLELGPLYYFLCNFSSSNIQENDSNLLNCLLAIYSKHILNEHGMECLKNQKLAQMINGKIREKFRNPPAHTRYVNVETAYECRQYVESNLKELSRCLL